MTKSDDVQTRCEWLTKDPNYIEYHDKEWGKPEFDSLKLFEMLCLEGQQAGLSWITILKKRDNYRKLFHSFNPYKICKFTEKDVRRLLTDVGIVRHKDFIWSFVDHKTILNNVPTNKDVKSETTTSVAMSKALKKRGFKYVGSTICYAFMQACGLVDDHLNSCIFKSL